MHYYAAVPNVPSHACRINNIRINKNNPCSNSLRAVHAGILIWVLLMEQLQRETCGSHFTSLSITVLFFCHIWRGCFQQRNPVSVSVRVQGQPLTWPPFRNSQTHTDCHTKQTLKWKKDWIYKGYYFI